MEMADRFHLAAEAIRGAWCLVITAGAGMGVDSGLPDFRGDRGFWNAYPMYERLGLSFADAANPDHFERDPEFGWGFYGHRTNLYRETQPHQGFELLHAWVERFGLQSFVVTSNVDGHFQKAGFPEDSILEVHGSINHLQCSRPCSASIWDNTEQVAVDLTTMRARHVPTCIHCGAVARPNILMFNDWSWIAQRTEDQHHAFNLFLSEARSTTIVVIELGAGTAVPTIRNLSESLGYHLSATVIRINPREPQIHAPHLSLACGALDGLKGIAGALEGE